MDWFVALAPLLALIVILLFGFTGCALDREGLAPEIRVTVTFFPSGDPRPEILVRATPFDAGDFTSADFPPIADPPSTGMGGSAQQVFGFAVRREFRYAVLCSVVQSGRTVIREAGVTVPVIPAGRRAEVVFTAPSAEATDWFPAPSFTFVPG
jgi:hypothetical protein